MTKSSIIERPVADDVRAEQQAQWSRVAWGWGQHAAYVDARGAETTAVLLRLTAPQPGERVLELACGTGGPGLAAAPLVGPEGEVVLSDVSPEMTALAAARAAALGLGNVTTRLLDLEQIDEPDASYDVVVAREGLMLVHDPTRAAAEIARVLRPGGRVAVSVWADAGRNPWLGGVFAAVRERLGVPAPPPGTPHPFALGDAGLLTGVLSRGGLADISVQELPTPYTARSADEWWERTSALAGPLAERLAAMPAPAVAALRSAAIERIAQYETPAGLEIPGVALIAAARRA